MKFIIHRDNLLPALEMLSPVPDRKMVIPVCSMFKLAALGTKLSISANNLEVSASSSVVADSCVEGGSTLVPARRFVDFVSGADEEISFATSPGRMRVSSGRSHIEAPTLDPGNFPLMEFHDPSSEFWLPSSILKSAIEIGAAVVDWGESRRELSGVLLHGDGQILNVVATDGRRLVQVAAGEVMREYQFQIILPQLACRMLTKLDDGSKMVKISINDRLLRAESGEFSFISKTIDAVFPCYQKIISPQTDRPVSVFGPTLLRAVTRSGMLAEVEGTEKTRSVRLSVENGRMTVEAGGRGGVEFFDEIDVEGDGFSGEFQVRFLRDALAAFGDGAVELHVGPNGVIRLNAKGSAHDCAILVGMRSRDPSP